MAETDEVIEFVGTEEGLVFYARRYKMGAIDFGLIMN
jgi:hypothetical protein